MSADADGVRARPVLHGGVVRADGFRVVRLGPGFAVTFGVLTAVNWDRPTALEGDYPWFGALVAAEVIAAGTGCLVLARRGASRWMAWWVAVVVAVHFLPLALLLNDLGVAV